MARRSIVRGWAGRALAVTVATSLVLGATSCQLAPRTLLAEDFAGATLDRAVWHPNRWFASRCAAGATSTEEQWYRPSAVTVGGGTLVLTATAGADTCQEASWSGTRQHTSGWVQTGGSRTVDGTTAPGFLFTFGRVDVRFRADAGAGLWPAVWLLAPGVRRGDGKLSYPSRPEIDVVEIHGDEPDRWRFHLHSTDGATRVDEGEAVTGPDTSTGFHTASVDWRPDRITWLVDGVTRWTYTGPGIPQEPMYVVLDLALGGVAGPPDPAALPARMVVDSVRVTS
ncbi:MAG TPA: glycoside hydrolase family 16 protein [Aquihabitans sp.]|nr:glycoside hydrolase family 16 protein [Aquihabitans sp.]